MRKLIALLLAASCFGQTTVAPNTTVVAKTTLIKAAAGGGGSTSLGGSCHNFAASGAGTSCTVTVGTTGSAVLVGVVASGATVSSISDGASYTLVPSSSSTNGSLQTVFYVRCNVTSGSYTPAITLSTGAESDIWVWEVVGAVTTCTNQDVVGVGSANSSPITTGSVSTTQAGDFVAAVGSSLTQSVSATGNAPWTGDTIQNGNGAQYQVNVANSTALTANMTIPSSGNYAASLVAIKAQ